jgi:hypothetical protein
MKTKRERRAYNAAYRKKNRRRLLAQDRARYKRLKKNKRKFAAMRAKRAPYYAAYRKTHKQEAAAASAAHYKKNRRKLLATRKARYRRQKREVARWGVTYYKKNKRRIAATHATYNEKNKRKNKERAAKWRNTLSGQLSARTHNHKRRTQKYAAPYIPHEARPPSDGRCPCCRVKMNQKGRKPRAPSLDHILALNSGGHHVPGNSWITCHLCNWIKRDRPLSYLLDRLKLSKAARRRVYRIVRKIRSEASSQSVSERGRISDAERVRVAGRRSNLRASPPLLSAYSLPHPTPDLGLSLPGPSYSLAFV